MGTGAGDLLGRLIQRGAQAGLVPSLVSVGRTLGRAAVVTLALNGAQCTAFFVIAGDVGPDRPRANRRVGLRPLSGARLCANRLNDTDVRYAAAAVAWISPGSGDAMHARARRAGGVEATLDVAANVAVHVIAVTIAVSTEARATVRHARPFCIGERAQRDDYRAPRQVLRSRQPVHQ